MATTRTSHHADGSIQIVSAASRPPSLRQAVAIRMSSFLWRRRAKEWDQEGSQPLTPVVDAVLEASRAGRGTVAVDLGCGSGQVTLPLARRCAHVLAVDLSAAAVELLKEQADEGGIANVHALPHPIETFDLGPRSVDLVVSNYAFHHLRDRDKAAIVRQSFDWLRPKGRLVIGDMMLGRGADNEDRAILADKVRVLARRGPAGWWRIVKNAWRFLLRMQEKPLPPAAWEAIVREAGFDRIRTRRVLAEACVLTAVKPGGTAQSERRSVVERLAHDQQR